MKCQQLYALFAGIQERNYKTLDQRLVVITLLSLFQLPTCLNKGTLTRYDLSARFVVAGSQKIRLLGKKFVATGQRNNHDRRAIVLRIFERKKFGSQQNVFQENPVFVSTNFLHIYIYVNQAYLAQCGQQWETTRKYYCPRQSDRLF